MTNATNALAANDAPRAPTADELAETNALQDARLAQAESLQSYTVSAFVSGVHRVYSWKLKAVLGLSARYLAEQVAASLTDGDYSEQKDAFVWNQVAVDLALSGVMIWRGTESAMESLAALSGKAAKDFARSYVKREGDFSGDASKGWKLADSIQDLKSDADTLRDFVRSDDNAKAWIREMALIASNGPVTFERNGKEVTISAAAAAIDYFTRKVSEQFGTGFEALHAGLATVRAFFKDVKKAERATKAALKASATPATDAATDAATDTGPTESVDPVDSLIAGVAALSDADFVRFMVALRTHAADRTGATAQGHAEPALIEQAA